VDECGVADGYADVAAESSVEYVTQEKRRRANFMCRLERVQSEQGCKSAGTYQPHDGRVHIYDIMQARVPRVRTNRAQACSLVPLHGPGICTVCSLHSNAQLDGRPHKQMQKSCVASRHIQIRDAACLSPQQAHSSPAHSSSCSCSCTCRRLLRARGLEALSVCSAWPYLTEAW